MAGDRRNSAAAGFVLWLLTTTGLGLFILWSGLSESALHLIQLTYYPDPYWAAACPLFVTYVAIAYFSLVPMLALHNTRPLTDLRYVTDPHAKGPTAALGSLDDEDRVDLSIPPIFDLDVTVSSRLLYQAWEGLPSHDDDHSLSLN